MWIVRVLTIIADDISRKCGRNMVYDLINEVVFMYRYEPRCGCDDELSLIYEIDNSI